VNMKFSVRLMRVLAGLCLLASVGLYAQRAAAVSADPRMYGPWVVIKTPSQQHLGMRVYFSPDGNFFMADPRSKLGYVGNWEVGRSGLLVSIYGNGRWAKLWESDVSFKDKNHMMLDVKDSQFSSPHRVVLNRIRF
jgi:hypothetical protein